jgi:hypothetical protein
MELFNRINIKVIEFICTGAKIRRFGVYGKINIPLINTAELSGHFIAPQMIIGPLSEESVSLGIKQNYEVKYEPCIFSSIKYLNKTLETSVNNLNFNKRA